MRRGWEYFDVATIRSEIEKLPAREGAKLLTLMKHYEGVGLGNPSPVQVDDYGGGLYRLRHIKSTYQGRALFFASDRQQGFERLVVLTVFKKESNEVPANIERRARNRMTQYLEDQKK